MESFLVVHVILRSRRKGWLLLLEAKSPTTLIVCGGEWKCLPKGIEPWVECPNFSCASRAL